MDSARKRVSSSVPAELDGERLDRALLRLFDGPSRSAARRWVEQGRVAVDGLPQRRPSRPVRTGERIELLGTPSAPVLTREEAAGKLPILFEDEDIAVIDKPAGLLSHRSSAGGEPSVSELAVALLGPLPDGQGEGRPGIVHRLDRQTSGLMVIARREASQEELMRQFRERQVSKTYSALVHGEPRFASEWIEEPIGRSRRHPDRMAVCADGREASTFYETSERLAGFALLAAHPHTGRTHQIRVHLSSIGHPVVGDRVYRIAGAPPRRLPSPARAPQRQMLHAAELAFRHPTLGDMRTFTAPLPADFAELLAHLRAAAAGGA
ncbi:MAG: RNA pseudouridine synthase [Planctomycetes bacterium]|jgi:23S rRNA pseudouridine1911/1915/1917 synthase|nr:RNA pseudouridine synthase [Planctomycetota bacterium]MDP6408735.1 RluA family pseudouridine synthase [Planctomycetota bacterium]